MDKCSFKFIKLGFETNVTRKVKSLYYVISSSYQDQLVNYS